MCWSQAVASALSSSALLLGYPFAYQERQIARIHRCEPTNCPYLSVDGSRERLSSFALNRYDCGDLLSGGYMIAEADGKAKDAGGCELHLMRCVDWRINRRW